MFKLFGQANKKKQKIELNSNTEQKKNYQNTANPSENLYSNIQTTILKEEQLGGRRKNKTKRIRIHKKTRKGKKTHKKRKNKKRMTRKSF
jgi:hypothetical protein